ncbi:hypothetical protein CRUP_034697 [Coryphaenoides rupestris]|nr:hypothetical protein CRUP_034697 [Coryphaenoides rupestris]
MSAAFIPVPEPRVASPQNRYCWRGGTESRLSGGHAERMRRTLDAEGAQEACALESVWETYKRKRWSPGRKQKRRRRRRVLVTMRRRELLFAGLLAALLGLSYPNPVEECSGMGVLLRSFNLMIKCNLTTLREKSLQQLQAPSTNLFIPILYLLAFCVGLPANLLALWVLVFRTKKLPSTTLLINLTATDIMLLLVLPFRIIYHFKGNDWVFGEPMCRVVMAIFYGNMYGCVLCLALVALDRYVALVHPFSAKVLRSQRTSLYMSLAVWLVVAVAMVPLLISQQSYMLDELQITTCHDALPAVDQEYYFLPYFTTLFTLCFLLPLLVIVYCYIAVLCTLVAGGRRYSHAVRVTVLVLVVFVVCLLPSNVLLLLTYSNSALDGGGHIPALHAVSTLNSCIDPFIFYYVSDDFREKTRNLLGCCGDGSATTSSSGNTVSYSSSSRIQTKLTSMSKSSMQATFEEDTPLQLESSHHT